MLIARAVSLSFSKLCIDNFIEIIMQITLLEALCIL